jgi:hypothetical protein
MVFGLRIEVRLNLLAELGVTPASHHERHKTGDEYSQINHDFSGRAATNLPFLPFLPFQSPITNRSPSSRLTLATVRAQLSASVANCLRPARVIE